MREMDKVIGYASIKEELYRLCDYLKNSERYEHLGVTEPKGLLLYGSPGIGKSLLAECFIKDVGRPYFVCRKTKSDGDFVNQIKKTFDDAKAAGPSIVYLDDLDKFGNEGPVKTNGDAYVTVQSCIDEVKDSKVFVIATVNDMHLLPSSLKRDGRFDTRIEMFLPKGQDAIDIVEFYLKKIPYVGDINPEQIAKILNGKSCATLKNVINEAGLRAGYNKKEKIDMNDILKACMRVIYDAPECIEKSDMKFLRNVAYHEAGHAVIQEVLEPGTVNLLSVLKNEGDIGGVTSYSMDDNYFKSIDFMENRVISLLGGKAATELKYGKIDTGCNNDLHRAFNIVERFVDNYCGYGFSSFIIDENTEWIGMNRNTKIAQEMEKYYSKAKQILSENNIFLEKLTDALVEKKLLTYYDIKKIKEEINLKN